MSSEFALSRTSPAIMKNNDVINRMVVIPMTEGQVGPFGKVIYAGIQVFLHDLLAKEMGQRHVKEHTEEVGIYEVYFPLSGQFEVTRGKECQTLAGTLTNEQTKGAEYKVTYNEQTNGYDLVVSNKDYTSPPIPGFVIPPETKHSTKQIGSERATFLAIKVDTK